jgi:methylated-DNA-[protein]-cysteine S-methyltransferase
MKELYYAPVETDWGSFMIAVTDKGVCNLHFLQDDLDNFFNWLRKKYGHTGEYNPSKVIQPAHQLKEYLAGQRKTFDVPLDLQGTPFQIKVWQALKQIPYGQTTTYAEIAQTVGVPKGPRAVGMANHNNPVLLMVPCHRVIGKNGSLVGFGCGLELKERLLELEKTNR